VPPVRPIVLAYDRSDSAKAAIAAAGRLFPGHAAVVVHVWQPVVEVGLPEPLVPRVEERLPQAHELDDIAREWSEECVEDGARRAREAGLGEVHTRSVRARRAAEGILATADEHDAEAIVVGDRGLSAVSSVLLGSVSDAVVRHARRPVVVIPSRRDPGGG
jgi:nucleotide-binding universal stress UspA family protein